MIDLPTVVDLVGARIRFGDADPEVGHGMIDELSDSVLRAIAAGSRDSQEMAKQVVALLDYEDAEDWIRWYA